MAVLRVSKRFVELLQSGKIDYVVAKIRLSREWYSDLRQLDRELHDIDDRISQCCESDDDYSERFIIMLQIDYYHELLSLFGFDPLHDPEYSDNSDVLIY